MFYCVITSRCHRLAVWSLEILNHWRIGRNERKVSHPKWRNPFLSAARFLPIERSCNNDLTPFHSRSVSKIKSQMITIAPYNSLMPTKQPAVPSDWTKFWISQVLPNWSASTIVWMTVAYISDRPISRSLHLLTTNNIICWEGLRGKFRRKLICTAFVALIEQLKPLETAEIN